MSRRGVGVRFRKISCDTLRESTHPPRASEESRGVYLGVISGVWKRPFFSSPGKDSERSRKDETKIEPLEP